MSIGGFSQCEKLSECEVANEHRRVLAVRCFLGFSKQLLISKTINKMIKVIKLGNLPIEVQVTKSCSKCGTVFSYQKEDIQVDREGSYVICPHCGSFISAR